MKNRTVVLSVVIIVLLIAALAYATLVYIPSETAPEKETITIVDVLGVAVEVEVPVERIVSLASDLSEIICALGGEDRLVGRDATSIFPPSILEKPVVGESSYNPNLEVLLELNPDLVVSDSMLTNETRQMIEGAGVPVFISTSGELDPRSTVTAINCTGQLVRKFGLILGEEEKADEIVDYMGSYENLVNERIENLTSSEKPLVYYEWYMSWYSCVTASVAHAGGINLAAEEPISFPTLSPEYVVEKNPDVIIRMITSLDHVLVDFETMREEILNRPGLSEVNAVKEGRVYIYDYVVRTGMRLPAGLLYWAKWFHPSLFEDIDPADIHKELIQEFFGIELEGVFAYP
jgi:iron complex transport system substrate-binding protein